ncbi:MAG: hypothetical protein LQ337_003367 [Flavoplaca oasis]|nr:MAG: hypothetical protein LQ337_003367 [Flavoplaca oasis]
MTTRSPSVLVDGTSSAISTSRTTSLDGEQDVPEFHPTPRHHLEDAFLQRFRLQHHRPSAASFDSSLNGMEDGNNVDRDRPNLQQHRGGSEAEYPTQVDGTEGHSSQSPTPNVDTSTSYTPSSEGGTDPPDALTNEQPVNNGDTDQLIPDPAINTRQSPTSHADALSSHPPQTSTTPQELSSQASQRPSATAHATRPNHHIDERHLRRRQRLLRWLRRRVDHPLPWHLSLRRRTENLRRRISDVDRVLP